MLRLTRRYFMALALLATLVPAALAQNQIYTTPFLDEKPEDVLAKASSLAKQVIPDREQLILRDLDRIASESAIATSKRTSANFYQRSKSYAQQSIDRLKRSSSALAAFDCDKNINRYRYASQSYFTAFNLFSQVVSSYAPSADVSPIQLPPRRDDDVSTCTDTKEKFSSVEFATNLNNLFDLAQSGADKLTSEQTALASAYEKYLEALNQRQSQLQEKLNSSQPLFQIGNNLWILLLILAFACVSAILGISLFSPELQFEWVASGQVIQFVTVMILLIVILALGLSGILKENVLGTLLGGIAGYVLAQGVGRSAARDVTRAAMQPPPFAASAPPPASPMHA